MSHIWDILSQLAANVKTERNRIQGSPMQRFGEKLRTLRKRRGMTIKELAQAIGQTTHSHISELETGRRPPSLEIALKISRMFGVSVDKLVKDELELD